MASSHRNTIEELITCVICHDLFDDPRVLPCSHTYCRQCMEQIASANNEHFECPFRDGFNISKNEIDTLPLNRIARDMTDVYASVQNPTRCSNCRTAVGEFGCDKCEDDSFCSDCYQTVHSPHVMQKHQPIPIDDKPPEMISCDTHLDEKVKYWCTTCATLVCTDCILLEHKTHQYNLIHKIAKELEVKITSDLNIIQSGLDENINRVDKFIDDIEQTAELNRRKISETMAGLRQAIEKHEHELLTQISRIEIEQKNQMETYKVQWKYEPRNLNIQRATVEILLATKNYAKLLNITREFDDYIKRTNELLKTMSIPTVAVYEIKGLDQSEVIKTEIFQCGQCVSTQSGTLNIGNEGKQELYLDPAVGPRIFLTGTSSNEFPNDMYFPKQQRQKRLCRK